MRLFHAGTYQIPLPDGHRFPRNKNRLAREALPREGLVAPEQLALSPLAARGRLVFETFAARGIPLSFGIGGGYCDPIEHPVAAYENTVTAAKAVHRF